MKNASNTLLLLTAIMRQAMYISSGLSAQLCTHVLYPGLAHVRGPKSNDVLSDEVHR